MFSIFKRRNPTFVKLVLNCSLNKPYTNAVHLPKLSSLELSKNVSIYHHVIRHKSKKGQNQPSKPLSESETGTESTFDDQIVDKHTKVMEVIVKSPRIDGVLKAGLGIARNKIETLFYESKIRLNGQKLLKKSELVQEGDEIDVVKGANLNNPDFLTVARVEVLGVKEKGDNVQLKIRRCKSLTIENYDDNVDTKT